MMSSLWAGLWRSPRGHACLLVLLATLLILGSGIGLRDPWPADEPRFVLAAKTMVESGDYWFPRRGIELYSDKPPMFMWLLAASYHLVGNWSIAFLLPTLLAGLLTIALTMDLTRRLFGLRAAAIAGWSVLLAVQFTYQFKRAQIDPVLLAMVCTSIYSFMRYYLTAGRARWFVFACFCAGLGVITKGVGIIALLILPWVPLARRWGWRGLRETTTPWSLGLFGAAAFFGAIALWVLPMLWQVQQSGDPALTAYAKDILLGQTATRYVKPSHHIHPWYYFIEVMALAWLPFSLLWPFLAKPLWQQQRRRPQGRVLLPLAWALSVVVFFSLSPGKRDMYILPALPMFAVALAPAAVWALRQRRARVALWSFALLLAVVFALGGALAIWGEPRFETAQEAARGLDPTSDAAWWMLLSVGLIGLGASALLRPRHGPATAAAVLGAFWIVGFGWWGYPLFNPSNSAREVMQSVALRIGPTAELGLVAWKEQNMLQARRPVTDFGFKQPRTVQLKRGLQWLDGAPQRRWLLIEDSALGDCAAGAEVIGRANRRNWVLLHAGDPATECVRRA